MEQVIPRTKSPSSRPAAPLSSTGSPLLASPRPTAPLSPTGSPPPTSQCAYSKIYFDIVIIYHHVFPFSTQTLKRFYSTVVNFQLATLNLKYLPNCLTFFSAIAFVVVADTDHPVSILEFLRQSTEMILGQDISFHEDYPPRRPKSLNLKSCSKQVRFS